MISTHYDSQKMRQHLVDCLEAQKIIPFTSAYEEKSHKFMNEEAIHIYCHCRGPESAFMIQGDGCCKWYHIRSVTNPSHKEH